MFALIVIELVIKLDFMVFEERKSPLNVSVNHFSRRCFASYLKFSFVVVNQCFYCSNNLENCVLLNNYYVENYYGFSEVDFFLILSLCDQ